MDFTLKQYQNKKMEEYKKTNYWKNALKLKKEMRNNIINSKMEKFKKEWYNMVLEFGVNNELQNKIIYSFDKEYGREHLLHCFRGNRKGLNNWINNDAIDF